MHRPVIFISYSHDDDAHRGKVLGLAQRLRADGFDTRLDRFVQGTPKQGWARWMLDELDAGDSVLVICTETYYRRFRGHEEPGRGKGADWEGALITQEIYDPKSRTTKFVPVLFSSDARGFIPELLRPHTHYTLSSEAAYQELCTFLKGRSGIKPAPLGELTDTPRATAAALSFDQVESPMQSTNGATARKVAPSRLSHTAQSLFGRESDLQKLNEAWAEPNINIVTLVAWGGVGKTSLVANWTVDLARRNHDV